MTVAFETVRFAGTPVSFDAFVAFDVFDVFAGCMVADGPSFEAAETTTPAGMAATETDETRTNDRTITQNQGESPRV